MSSASAIVWQHRGRAAAAARREPATPGGIAADSFWASTMTSFDQVRVADAVCVHSASYAGIAGSKSCILQLMIGGAFHAPQRGSSSGQQSPHLVGVRDHGQQQEVAICQEGQRPEDRLQVDRPERHDQQVLDEQRQLRAIAAAPPGAGRPLPRPRRFPSGPNSWWRPSPAARQMPGSCRVSLLPPQLHALACRGHLHNTQNAVWHSVRSGTAKESAPGLQSCCLSLHCRRCRPLCR